LEGIDYTSRYKQITNGSMSVLIRSGLFAFIASAATLVLELIAGRMMAPFIGVSLYTWTSIIGVVLAGVSVGSWLGGRLADRHPSARLLGGLFMVSALTSLSTVALIGVLGDGELLDPLPLLARIFLLTALLFLAPSLLLGMVTPLAVRLALLDLRATGRVVGLIYALGTAGSLVGNFLTGFILTAYLPLTTIVLAVAALLLLAAVAAWAIGERTGIRRLADSPSRPLAVSPTRKVPDSPAFRLGYASAIVLISSFCTMAIELSASRILAPTVGTSLYSWTGIIGVVLAGIAAGNFLGGQIADRWPQRRVLGLCLFFGGLGAFSILAFSAALNTGGALSELELMQRIVALTAMIFFLPVLLLGTISPQVIRLSVGQLSHAGRVSGQIYAWSTAGAIVGTFATGWWLISEIGVNGLVFSMGVILIALASGVGRFWQQRWLFGGAVAITVAAVFALASRGALASPCTEETNYFCIRVQDTVRDGVPVRTLVLDHLIHSYVKIGDPSYLGYEHEYVQAELTRYELARGGPERVLVIGGGGYTYPRWVEAMLPGASVEVVEIDPGVTEVAYEYLGLPRDTAIVSHNLDGRQFVDELAPSGRYAVVVQDAVNDLSVPYHLMTKEYNDQIKTILAPGGVYLLTVIDLYEDGQLLRAATRTMFETFERVQLLAASRAWDSGAAAVWVVAGSDDGIDLNEMREVLAAQGHNPMRTIILEPERLQTYVGQGRQIILTDEYAPVDNLIAPLFVRRG
jgi:spermidine synthase